VLESDWDTFLDRLVTQSKRAIDAFASDHPTEEVCYFAYDCEPCYGYVLTSFNTIASSLAKARERHDYHGRRLVELLRNPRLADRAYYYVRNHAVLPFCNNTGDFAYQQYATIEFPEWQAFYESADYPREQDPDKDYLTNRAARLFCHALDRLVQDQAFVRLRLANPTLLGFVFHDQEQRVLRLLNVPRSPG
jgi:hypothetical protein